MPVCPTNERDLGIGEAGGGDETRIERAAPSSNGLYRRCGLGRGSMRKLKQSVSVTYAVEAIYRLLIRRLGGAGCSCIL